ncbi:MAG: hypothetical protein ACUVV5_02440 [Candidatus Aminicenantales bacterium]
MKSEEDLVVYYSGYQSEETPRSVFIRGREYPVDEVLWRKRVMDQDSGKRTDIFICKVAGRRIEIRRDETGRSELFPSDALP